MKSRNPLKLLASSVTILVVATGCCCFDPFGFNRREELRKQREEYERSLPKPDEEDVQKTAQKFLPKLLCEMERADVGSSIVYVENITPRPLLFFDYSDRTSLNHHLCDHLTTILTAGLMENGKLVRPGSPAHYMVLSRAAASLSNDVSTVVEPTGDSIENNDVQSVAGLSLSEPYYHVLCRTSMLDEPTRVQYLFRIDLFEEGVTNAVVDLENEIPTKNRLLWTSAEMVSKPKTTTFVE